MNEEMFCTLYKSLVRPHLEYASPVCSPRLKKDQIAIENVQRRATKMIQKIKNCPYNERLRSLGLPSLEYRRERADMVQVYRIFSGIDNLSVDRFFPRVDQSQNENMRRTRSHSKKIFKTRCKTELRKSTFSQRVVNAWNSLPENIVTAPSLNTFKSRLNKLLNKRHL